MINDKQQLSRDILSVGGEAWITEYNNEELMELFALGVIYHEQRVSQIYIGRGKESQGSQPWPSFRKRIQPLSR